MDCAAFGDDAPGRLVRITGTDRALRQDYDHFAFVPDDLPASFPMSEGTYRILAEAERAVGRLDAAAERLPNPNLLVRPSLLQEAQSTSALEGTYAPLIDVLEADYVDERRRSPEVREIMNYVAAANRGLELIAAKPLCVTMLCELQDVLVRGTRGGAQSPGRLRESQVYLGERHRGIERSRFVPPPAGDTLRDGFYAWERWINEADEIPLLVKIALAHYQFETLHPFFDGNGRLGRLVIALQLVAAGALRVPILNLSPWLEPRKTEYKDLMLGCSQRGEFDPWVRFFGSGVKAQADQAVQRIRTMVEIRDEMRAGLRGVRARGVVLEIVDDLIAYPVITVAEAAALHQVTFPPASNAIQKLVDLGYLRELTGRNHGRVFGCVAIMNALEV